MKKPAEFVELNKTPWYPPVVAFREGSSIREAYAQWWAPELGSDLDTLLRAIAPRSAPEGIDEAFGGEKMRSKWKITKGEGVKVLLVLTYPLCVKYDREIVLHTKRFGDVFGRAHDLYREIYALDDAGWKEKGYKRAPIIGKKNLVSGQKVNLMNRQGGTYVWGHDLTDLVFEGLYFEPSAEAKIYLKAHRAFQKRKTHPKGTKPPRFNVKHCIGTVTFGIGS